MDLTLKYFRFRSNGTSRFFDPLLANTCVPRFCDTHSSSLHRASTLALLLDYARTVDFWQNVMKMPVDKIYDGGPRVRVSFQYPGDTVGLQFEMNANALKFTEFATTNTELPKTPVSQVVLIVYVNDLFDFVLRAKEFGYVCYLSPYEPNPLVQAAVLLDPNGIRVRLMRIATQPLTQVKGQTVKARLGSCQVPVASANILERNIKFYEDKCSPSSTTLPVLHAREGGAGGGRRASIVAGPTILNSPGRGSATLDKGSNAVGGAQRMSPRSMRRRSLAEPSGLGGAGLAAQSNRNSYFRVVDQERFMEDLVTYVWLGNHSRARGPTFCMVHKVPRSAALDPFGVGLQSDPLDVARFGAGSLTSPDREGDRDAEMKRTEQETDPVFVGLSFLVYDLEAALSALSENDIVGAGKPEIRRVQGLPRSLLLLDELSLVLELTDGVMSYSSLDLARSRNPHPSNFSSSMTAMSASVQSE